jgi:predicted DNA-binding protein
MLRSVKISDMMHERLKAFSKETGIKIQFILDHAIEEWLKAHPAKTKKAA